MNDKDIAFLDAILAGETPPPTPELLAAKAAHADLFGGDPDPRDAEIARLRAALEWYADPEIWKRLPPQKVDHDGYAVVYRKHDIYFDKGKKAREALEGS